MTGPGARSAADLAGESDLTRAIEEVATCLSVEPLGADLFEIRFRSPRIAAVASPGEFGQLRVDDGTVPLLRRPFSFSRADRESGMVSFYLGAVGQGSRRLGRFREGDRLRILGPLGRGFSLPESQGRSVLVAGGLGAAPFPLLMQRLAELGEEVIWLNGARTAAELYPQHLLPAGNSACFTITEDGSAGDTGLVTDRLAELAQGARMVYACGPNPMLAAVHRLWERLRFTGGTPPSLEVSIEAPMGCGFGTCLGCAVPLNSTHSDLGQYGLCCRQGPVFAAGLLDWERLLRQPAHLG